MAHGFKNKTKAEQLEIASKGGKAVHASGRAYRFTPEKAREAAALAAASRRAKRQAQKQEPAVPVLDPEFDNV